MTAPILINPAAERDSRSHETYLAQSSPATARRFLQALRRSFEELAGMPGLGSQWETEEEDFAGLRCRFVQGFPNHLIFYRSLLGEAGGIEVLRILHASQNIGAIFGGSPS